MALNMNRETKIGLAVILTLLTVLCVVLVRRMTRSPDAVEAAAAADNEKTPPKDADDSAETATKMHKRWTTGKPTLLSPSGPSLGNSKRSPDDFGRWKMPTDAARKASGSDAFAARQYQPNAMPDARLPASDDRYSSSSDPRPTTSSVMPAATGGADGSVATSSPAQLNRADPVAVAVGGVATDPPSSTTVPATAAATIVPSGQATNSLRTTDSSFASTPIAVAAPTGNDASLASGSSATGSAYSSSASTTPSYQPAGLATAGTTAVPTAMEVPRREDGKYEVQPNDNYWTISEKLYGTGAYFRALAEHNRGKAARADRLQPGLTIAAPPVAQLEQSYPDLCPKPNRREAVRSRAAAITTASFRGDGRAYVVQEGDTLFTIARNELGKASRWAEIYALNRETLGKDFDYLTPGMSLTLPSKDARSSDRTARRSETPYQR